MSQILHIFRKDSRHFWPEILISLVVLAAFVIHLPAQWAMYRYAPYLFNILRALYFLVPVSWWLLIGRVVHAESLVGDEQFWITRPFEWKKLLAAKLLFLAAWIGLPYIIAQSFLLAHAGFQPLPDVPGILSNLLFASVILILPLMSIAAVTSNFARMTLTLLGGLVVVVAFSLFSNTGNGYQISTPYRNNVLLPLMFCFCAAAIILQYVFRRVWLSRALLLVLPILITASYFAYDRQSLVDRAYPQSSSASASPMLVTLGTDSTHLATARSWQSSYYLDLPLRYTGVADGNAIFADDYKVTITGADGYQWTSPWQSFSERIVPGVHRAELSFRLSPALFDRFRSAPVNLRIAFALTRLQSGTVTRISAPSSDTAIPNIGFCSPRLDRGSNDWTGLYCRSAIRPPQLAYATTLWSSEPCSSAPSAQEATLPGSTWTGTLDPNDLSGKVYAALTPVPTSVVFFSMHGSPKEEGSSWHLCPGTPITFTQYHVVDRTQSDFTIPNFQIPAKVTQTGY